MNKPSETKPTQNETKSAKVELDEQDLDKVSAGNIGSQSSGAGAGKITFNPFSITRK